MIKKIVSLVLFICLFSIGQSMLKVSKGEQFVPTLFGYTGMTVMSGSMAPTIEVGDFVLVRETNDTPIKVDDVITYKQDSQYVTHRVIECLNDSEFVTQGDANNTADLEPVHRDEIVGIKTVAIPKLGSFFMWIKTTEGLLTCGVIFMILIWLPDKKSKINKEAKMSDLLDELC